MISKIILSTAFLALAVAQYDHGYDHGHAVSSQSFVLHQSSGHEQYAPAISHQPSAVRYHEPAPVPQYHEQAPVLSYYQPSHHSHHENREEYHAPAPYSFEYSVKDPKTGDLKSHKETRNGDAVQGFYSLHEADGTVRRVEYTADAHNGFQAVVHRDGHVSHPVPVQQPIPYAHH